MIGVAAFWKAICQGDGWPSPARPDPRTTSIAAPLGQHQHSIENRHSFHSQSPNPFVRARRPVKGRQRPTMSTTWTASQPPRQLGRKAGRREKCSTAVNGVAPSFDLSAPGPDVCHEALSALFPCSNHKGLLLGNTHDLGRSAAYARFDTQVSDKNEFRPPARVEIWPQCSAKAILNAAL